MSFQVVMDALLFVLQTVFEFVASIFAMLPNPDPFPEMIQEMGFENVGDVGAFAFWWCDQFIDMDMFITLALMWVELFPVAWVIMLIWRWIKATNN